MAVTDWMPLQVCSDDAAVGTLAWVKDDASGALVGTEVLSNNGVYAGIIGATSVTTHYLKALNGLFSVPVGSTIGGAEFRITIYRDAPWAVVAMVAKFVRNGSIAGNDIGNAIDWPLGVGNKAAQTIGSDTEGGGLSWTPAAVNAATSGIALSITLDGTVSVSLVRTHFVDFIEQRWHYLPPAGTSHSEIIGRGGLW